VPHPRRIGLAAENETARLLARQGWTVLAQRWRGGGGEIDLAALDGEVLVFIEVKLRRSGGSPEEAVSPAKQARLRSAAEAFIAEFGLEARRARFDVAAWDGGVLRWTQNAF